LSGGLPWLGRVLDMRFDPVNLMWNGYKQHGEVFSFQLAGTPTVGMVGPRAHETFFRLPDDQISLKEAYQLMVPIFGKGIAYDASPEVMKEQLGFFHAALRDSRLKTYADGFVEEAEEYFGKWGDSGEVDMYNVGNELTIYTSARSLLGTPFRRKLSGEFAKLYAELEAGLSVLAFFAPNLPTPAFKRRDAARARMGKMIERIVAERRREGSTGDDFLATLMEASYSDGRKLTEDEMTGLLLTIMFAGHHTSGVTFAWTGILLNQNRRFLPGLLDEQKRILGDRRNLTLDDLRAMSALERTVKETLRLYPPLILLMRKVMKDFKYDQYDVPAGSMIMASPAAAHRIPEVFANPDQFDPDRFGPGREEDKKNPMGWIAFGAGRHRCMGIVFAQLQIRAIWSVLLRDFEFDLVESKYEPDYNRLLVGPRQPCRVRYRRKKKAQVAVPASVAS
jgi:sterol 14-demethylase